ILSADFCDGSIDDGFVQDATLNGGGSSFVANRNYQGSPERASAPRRNEHYGCSGSNLGANTSFLNQALVIRGNNWPAPDPNRDGAGVLRFDNTNGAQNLGNHVRQPGWPEVFARDTIFARRDRANPSSNNADRTAGLGVPEVRLLRAPDAGYANFGTRISALGNPVLDTSRWLLIASLQPCRPPEMEGGGGLLAEYYNGWITSPTSPQNQYNRNTGFGDTDTDVEVSELLRAPDANLPYLRAVRWPDPIYPDQHWRLGVPNQSFMREEDQGGPKCDPSGDWNTPYDERASRWWPCIRDALETDKDGQVSGWQPDSFARWVSGTNLPVWGGFYYLFANQEYINTNSPFLWPWWGRELNDRPTLPKADFLWMPRCSEPDMNPPQLPADAPDIDRGNIGFWRSCWRRREKSWGSGNNYGNDFFVVRWVGELYPRWPGV
ncbi:type II secretion system protein, partial [Synechococcus sp. R55.2]